jgi:DHA1 family inner membrane transport protein
VELEKEQPVEARGLYAVYATAFFSLSLVPMTSLVVPLWALYLGATPVMIGIVVAARSVLPLFLSIHGGAMMDRLGTRRLMLIFTAAGAVLTLLYPVLPYLSALIALQLLLGWAQGMGWLGAQTKLARLSRGNATYAAHFSFFTTLGTFLGPLVAGAAWDLYGAWGAFIVITVWGAALAWATQRLPMPAATAERSRSLTWRDMVPNLSDYVRAFALMSIPAIALVVVATFLRIAVFTVQGSFYTVYLEGIGMSGTLIGVLIGGAALIGGPAALLTAPMLKKFRAHWLLLGSIAVPVVAICITPLLHSFLALMIAAAVFGLGLGMGLPLLLSALSDASGTRDQGISVGLRTTANRLASIVIPLLMGFIIEIVGIQQGFFVTGAILLGSLAVTAWVVHRSPAFANA